MPPTGAWARVRHALRGPRLQVLNLAVFYAVVCFGRVLRAEGVAWQAMPWEWLRQVARIDYPNPPTWVALSVLLAAALDAGAQRWRTGRWAVPWGTVVATMGIWLMLNGRDVVPFLLLPLLLVGSKHLVRTKRGHILNANNFAAVVLILAGLVTLGVNDWGTAKAPVALMFLFGTVATVRARRFTLALTYLVASGLVYAAAVAWLGYDWTTWLPFAFPPVAVMLGWFAVTDPATSPRTWHAQVVYALLAVLLAVPATLALHMDAVVFALAAAAPQRLWIEPMTARLAAARARRRHPERVDSAAPVGPELVEVRP